MQLGERQMRSGCQPMSKPKFQTLARPHIPNISLLVCHEVTASASDYIAPPASSQDCATLSFLLQPCSRLARRLLASEACQPCGY